VTVYLDASVLVTIIAEEPTSEIVDAFLERHGARLGVSDFAAVEVASAMSRMVRTHMITQTDAKARLVDFDAWRSFRTRTIDIEQSDFRLANTYVRRFDLMLRAPDALHAAICGRLNLTLVTLDRRLAKAARELGIDVIFPAS
jgi:predicted nucleic acid-binding protein